MIFNEWTVSLGAYLLDQFRPDTETLGSWIANYREIERRVQGTIHQYTLPANSPQQRAGVLGTLALAGDPLWMMPSVIESAASSVSASGRGTRWVGCSFLPTRIRAMR